MGTIRLGKRTEDRSPLVKDFVPLARSTTSCGARGTCSRRRLRRRVRAGVLEAGKHIEAIAEALRDIRPMHAAFDASTPRNIDGETPWARSASG